MGVCFFWLLLHTMQYVDVLLPLPLEGVFSYTVPPAMQGKAVRGVRVLVPLGRSKRYVGLVMRQHRDKPKFKCKDILEVLDDRPVVLESQLRLWQWIATYYMSPLGEVLNAALPGGMKSADGYKPKTEACLVLPAKLRSEQALHVALDTLQRAARQKEMFGAFLELTHWDTITGEVCRQTPVEVSRDELLNYSHGQSAVLASLLKRGFMETIEREVPRLNHGGEPHMELIKRLSEPQQDAYNNILMQLMGKNVVLLHGVTSSGKTEIYMHLIRQALERKQQVLYLLPEIALTVQIRQRLGKVFGSRLGVYHSKYSDAERVEIWQKQLSANPYDIILGARSATLLPFQNLGLVIVDEEHETSFKQQDPAPRYHARSAAIVMATMCGAKVVLGTATPSAESWHNAETGKYGKVSLLTRHEGIEMPEIRVVDVADLTRRKMMSGPFSPVLLSEIRRALDNKRQVILFQNRRGFAPRIECKACGWVPRCGNCDVSLTYHRNSNQLSCHYCGATYDVPQRCPCCEGTQLMAMGYGTEKIEDRIMGLFPDARVARMDLDTTRSRHAYESIISDFSAHRTNILIGTQMVSKGLDFDNVSVVGILNADTMLNRPDFRAYEFAFGMMSQVAGRAGRKGRRGLVLLQTRSAQLPLVQQVVGNNWPDFYRDLMEERRTFSYPPFCHLVFVYLKHRDDSVVDRAARQMAQMLKGWFGARVMGPDKPSVAWVKALNIRKIMVKLEPGIDMQKARACLQDASQRMQKAASHNSLQIYFDVDPL